MSLKDLCERYHRHQLHKEAGFWSDWGNGIVGGLRELWRPVQDVGRSVEDTIRGTGTGLRKRMRDWYHENIWDPDDYKWGALEGWLAGSALYDAQSKMAPVRVRRADGTHYYRMPSGKYRNNRDITNLVYDADTGTYETLEQANQRQRAQELKQEWQAFERKQIPELMKRGMTRERAYMELDSLRDSTAAQASQRGLKRAQDYLRTVAIPGGR